MCSKAISLNPGSAASYCNRGYAYSKLRNYTKAIDDYSMAIPAEFFEDRAWANGHMGQFQKEIDDSCRCIKINPKNANGHAALAQGYLGKFNTAIGLAAQAIYQFVSRLVGRHKL